MRWTKGKVWRMQSLPAPDDWWCNLPKNSGRGSKRFLDCLLCHPPSNSWAQSLCVCMCFSQRHSSSWKALWMLRDSAKEYEAWLLACGSLVASPHADKVKVNDASKISLILQMWLAEALERTESQSSSKCPWRFWSPYKSSLCSPTQLLLQPRTRMHSKVKGPQSSEQIGWTTV